ncbi:LysE family translocator [Photobacterium leiognathi]|uniref:LysE family translocator n=1 Tax=Photobacterium leiognathi TaxID=553611 RepID=UPI003AF35425
MEGTTILSLILFAALMTGTPGPNNMMVTASGANFGYWRSVPHITGISMGMASMITLLAAGLGIIFERYPMVHDVLKVVGGAYLLFLAWKIATSVGMSKTKQQVNAQPMSIFSAALFQYVNPKAWMMSATAVSTFAIGGEHYWLSITMIVTVFFVVGFACVSLWTATGVVIRRWLTSERRTIRFNQVMGGLTAACVTMIW